MPLRLQNPYLKLRMSATQNWPIAATPVCEFLETLTVFGSEHLTLGGIFRR